MVRLLVTGVDTLLGINLAMALSDRCEVLGLYDGYSVQSNAIQTGRYSRGDLTSLKLYFDSWQPQWCIHCGPQSVSSWDCSPTPRDFERELPLVGRLAELSQQWSTAFTLMSSDAVFAGPRMFHDESWPASNMTPRAIHTVALEDAVVGFDALVVRTHAYGWSADGESTGFVERALELMRRGRWPALCGRHYATPILATDLAELLWRAYDVRLRGLYHLAGAERTSQHRFLLELADSMGILFPDPINLANIESATTHNETSLSSKRARRVLTTAMPMVRDGIDRFVAQAAEGWQTRWQCVGIAHAYEKVAA